MSFFDEERFYKLAITFIRMLMLFTLVATFEHCYHTLSTFSAGHVAWGIPISLWAKALFVLTIDFGLYLGEWFIPQFKIRNIDTKLVQGMVIIFAVISAGLNVKYMVEFKPDDTLISYSIAWSVGLLIPAVLGVLGFIEGKIMMHRYSEHMFTSETFEPRPETGGRFGGGELGELAKKYVPTDEETQLVLQLSRAHNFSPERIAKEMKMKKTDVDNILKDNK
jgi:hypothetical protein